MQDLILLLKNIIHDIAQGRVKLLEWSMTIDKEQEKFSIIEVSKYTIEIKVRGTKMQIFKYALPMRDSQIIKLQGKPLSVINQNEQIMLYAPTGDEEKEYTILIAGTGHERFDLDGVTFIGTVSLHGGKFVFHVFYK